jgi:hypothetical protein
MLRTKRAVIQCTQEQNALNKEKKQRTKKCSHLFIDNDNDGCYGYEICVYCGTKRHK